MTALLLSLATPQAFADDYVALCMANKQGIPDAARLCDCASGVVEPLDRAAAIAAYRVVSNAAKGKPADKSSSDISRGMTAAMDAEAACN